MPLTSNLFVLFQKVYSHLTGNGSPSLVSTVRVGAGAGACGGDSVRVWLAVSPDPAPELSQ